MSHAARLTPSLSAALPPRRAHLPWRWPLALMLALMFGLGATGLRAESMARLYAPEGVALAGYDPVAYFTEARAVRGDAAIALRWRGVLWQFSSARHRAAFEANPRAYLPQLGGYCAVSMAKGIARAPDPEQWVIHDGRLYLAENRLQRSLLLAEPAAMVDLARINWPQARAGGAAE
ncbi:YHS domain-containing (seleno)protein [Alkalilacustris brevis]|uniref:YHS domain-containing (seleno)protein n=1 Tax=Alkalilacustris brevis TaxID=2026338 RepID=UPI0012D2FB91|nr:YHS domain-containing (seleno)protein [Alkalilacustris brevis]